MIASLAGRLFRKDASSVIVDVAGVGYLVQIPFSTFFTLGDVGDEVSLYIHTHVREDALALYGFASVFEQRLFEKLISVSGIGPRMGNTILSGIPADDLALAIRDGDAKRLTMVPGLGKKTAERLILELREKIADLEVQPVAPAPVADTDRNREDALSALVNLGWSTREATATLDAVDVSDDPDLETVLKRALTGLAK